MLVMHVWVGLSRDEDKASVLGKASRTLCYTHAAPRTKQRKPMRGIIRRVRFSTDRAGRGHAVPVSTLTTPSCCARGRLSGLMRPAAAEAEPTDQNQTNKETHKPVPPPARPGLAVYFYVAATLPSRTPFANLPRRWRTADSFPHGNHPSRGSCRRVS